MTDLADQASKPHERVMFNIAIFHFFVPAILFGTKSVWLSVGLSLLGSLIMIGMIARQAHEPADKPDLVQKHWQLAWKRCRYLLYSYLASAVIFGIGALLVNSEPDQSMRFIHLAIIGWFSLVPISLTVALLLIIEGSALVQARKGVFPADMKI